MRIKRKKMKFIVWVSYNKDMDYFNVEEVFEKRPKTRHTNPDVVSRKFMLKEL